MAEPIGPSSRIHCKRYSVEHHFSNVWETTAAVDGLRMRRCTRMLAYVLREGTSIFTATDWYLALASGATKCFATVVKSGLSWHFPNVYRSLT